MPSWRLPQSGSGYPGRISADIREECRISLLRLCLPARDIRHDDRGYPMDIHNKNWDFERFRVGRVRTLPPWPLHGAAAMRGADGFLVSTCACFMRFSETTSGPCRQKRFCPGVIHYRGG